MFEPRLAVAEIDVDLVDAICVQDGEGFAGGVDAVSARAMSELDNQAEGRKGGFLEEDALPMLYWMSQNQHNAMNRESRRTYLDTM